jgi:hypothetical protein
VKKFQFKKIKHKTHILYLTFISLIAISLAVSLKLGYLSIDGGSTKQELSYVETKNNYRSKEIVVYQPAKVPADLEKSEEKITKIQEMIEPIIQRKDIESLTNLTSPVIFICDPSLPNNNQEVCNESLAGKAITAYSLGIFNSEGSLIGRDDLKFEISNHLDTRGPFTYYKNDFDYNSDYGYIYFLNPSGNALFAVLVRGVNNNENPELHFVIRSYNDAINLRETL